MKLPRPCTTRLPRNLLRPTWVLPALLSFLLLNIYSAGAAMSFPEKATAAITNIDVNSGIVSAKDSASGQVFQFKLTNPMLLRSLTVGQTFFVDIPNKLVSFDGSRINGNIVNLGPVDGAKPLGPVDGSRPAGPIDGARPAGPIDGARPAGPIDGARPAGPVDGARPVGPIDGARPAGPIDGARPVGPIDGAKPSGLSCQITSIDAGRSLVTARDSQSGRFFQFRLANSGFLQSLKPGQVVFADFATNQVSLTLNGQKVNGSIVSVASTATHK